MRNTINADPFLPNEKAKTWREAGFWPASWVACPGCEEAPFVAAFRLSWSMERQETVRVHVSADERYELFLDGIRIGRGPERGSPDHWFFDTYDLPLQRGRHRLVAKVWALGEMAPDAQMSVCPGFLLAAESAWNEKLNTGIAAWKAKKLGGHSFQRADLIPWRGYRFVLAGNAIPWGYESGKGRGWKPVKVLSPARGRWVDWSLYREPILKPAGLPAMQEQTLLPGKVRHLQELAGEALQRRRAAVSRTEHLSLEEPHWQALLEGTGSLTIPPHTTRRAILELPEYTSAYPQMVVSGGTGSQIEVLWAESLQLAPDAGNHEKGQREQVEGKYFVGNGDRFFPDGGERRLFEPLWWMAGRFIEIYFQTAQQALTVESLQFTERRYPLEMHSKFSSSDPRLDEIQPILLRGMQMCSNETFFDCPYYEELMYAGDTRLECLVTYVLTTDDRLPRKALQLFDSSRLANGMTQSRYPCRATQVISTFAVWWVGMVHDYLYWRNDTGLVRQLMPGVRATIQGFRRLIGDDGLLRAAEGWNTIDWVPAWSDDAGAPPNGHSGVSGLLNWKYIYALSLYEDLERQAGDVEQADWARRFRGEMAGAAMKAFFNAERGMLSDTIDHSRYSEHTQLMALLSGALKDGVEQRVLQGLFSAHDLDRATIYFSHYYFEICRKHHRMDKFFERMNLWFYLKEMGFKTPVESPEPSRSDCHAWSSHPLFHYFATLLGIRPAEPGFGSVEISPRPGSLTWMEGRLPHPKGGEIVANMRLVDAEWQVEIDLPWGLRGEFIWDGTRRPLEWGKNVIAVKA